MPLKSDNRPDELVLTGAVSPPTPLSASTCRVRRLPGASLGNNVLLLLSTNMELIEKKSMVLLWPIVHSS